MILIIVEGNLKKRKIISKVFRYFIKKLKSNGIDCNIILKIKC